MKIVNGIPAFYNLDDMWKHSIDIAMGGHHLLSRNGNSMEVIGTAMKLLDINRNFVLNEARKASPVYGCAELLWYLSFTDDIHMIKAYAPSYEKYANDGKAFGAYGHRWAVDSAFVLSDARFNDRKSTLRPEYPTQLHALLDLLKHTPNTRQAVMCQWNGGDLIRAIAGDKGDLPCTLSLSFSVRDSKLFLDVTMRSNDVWLGLPYDVFCFTTIQRIVADALSLGYGHYTHHVTSLHVYERDYERAKKAMLISPPPRGSESYSPIQVGADGLWKQIENALMFEECCRTQTPKYLKEEMPKLLGDLGDHLLNPIADAAIVCGTKFCPQLVPLIASGLLNEGTKTCS